MYVGTIKGTDIFMYKIVLHSHVCTVVEFRSYVRMYY